MYCALALRLLAVMLIVPCSYPLCAQTPTSTEDPLNYTGPSRKQDEVYVLSTRELPVPKLGEVLQFALQRWSEADTWESASLDAFRTDNDLLTLIYVHGYSFDEHKAERTGWAYYHTMCDALPSEQRVRFVVWSWPTTAKRFRPSRDLVEKAARADVDAIFLAHFVRQATGKERVVVIGSSLGCRVVQGAMHLLGGGESDGWKLNINNQHSTPTTDAIFISPAVHDDWMYDGQYHDKAVSGVGRLLLLNNSIDPTLRRYTQVYRGRARALGLDGI